MSLKFDGSRILQEVLREESSETFIVPNIRHVPRYNYNPDHDDSGIWKTYHSRSWYRNKKKNGASKKRQRKAVE